MDGKIKKNRIKFLAGMIICAIFGIVYECFSHGVYSAYMIFAFAIPLVLGVVPYMILGFVYKKYLPGQAAMTIYNSGVVTMTVGSIFAGILEIYGTTNRLLVVYPVAGIILIFAGIVVYFSSFGRRFQMSYRMEAVH